MIKNITDMDFLITANSSDINNDEVNDYKYSTADLNLDEFSNFSSLNQSFSTRNTTHPSFLSAISIQNETDESPPDTMSNSQLDSRVSFLKPTENNTEPKQNSSQNILEHNYIVKPLKKKQVSKKLRTLKNNKSKIKTRKSGTPKILSKNISISTSESSNPNKTSIKEPLSSISNIRVLSSSDVSTSTSTYTKESTHSTLASPRTNVSRNSDNSHFLFNIPLDESSSILNNVKGSTTASPVSIQRYTTTKYPRSVCLNDPCGAGVACFPNGKTFSCVCSDGTEIMVGLSCPNVRPINLTPPALSMPQANEVSLSPPSQNLLLVAVVSMSVFVLLLLSLVYWRRKRICYLIRQSNSFKIKTESEDNISKLTSLPSYNFVNNPNYYVSPIEQFPLQSLSVQLISKDQINFLGEIGEGCFGRVYKGEYRLLDDTDLDSDNDMDKDSSNTALDRKKNSTYKSSETNSKRNKIVAVKVLKELAAMESEADFMREVEIMATFKHPNILSLIGVVVADTGGTPWMVFEFMTFGDLAEVLRSSNKLYNKNYIYMKSLNKMDLLSICLQVAEGMEYLSLQHFVHRDLACRNCLVGENLTVKISDFGMSRDVYTCDYYKVGGSRMLPVRWMAPESILYGKFTLESDIWSFGVVLWEIYSLGKQPYYGNSNEEVVQLILQGTLLSPPESCPPILREVMTLCWTQEPPNRLTFPEIVQRLKECEDDFSKQEMNQDNFSDLKYSQLCLHDTPMKPSEFPLDNDEYLLPNVKANPDEYLTVLPEL